MTVHALLGGSNAHRWLVCTPGARLEETLPDSTSEHAEEGTLAHDMGEGTLKFILRREPEPDYSKYPADMVEAVGTYVGYVLDLVAELPDDRVILIEERSDYSDWVPSGFGTTDFAAIADGTLHVVDYKHGKGVEVDVTDNEQLKLYALGLWRAYAPLYQIHDIEIHIVQPRKGNLGSSWSCTVEALLQWANDVVRPAAELAWKGEGEFIAGDHCTFCRARYQCRARAEQNLQLVQDEFKPEGLLDLAEIAEMLPRLAMLEKWAHDLQNYARLQAEKGVLVPGHKLVAGRSTRKITNQDAAAGVLLANGFKPEQIYEPKSLLGITALEKAVGKKKFGELLAEHITKATGKPVLVPVTDPREEINSQGFETYETEEI